MWRGKEREGKGIFSSPLLWRLDCVKSSNKAKSSFTIIRWTLTQFFHQGDFYLKLISHKRCKWRHQLGLELLLHILRKWWMVQALCEEFHFVLDHSNNTYSSWYFTLWANLWAERMNKSVESLSGMETTAFALSALAISIGKRRRRMGRTCIGAD